MKRIEDFIPMPKIKKFRGFMVRPEKEIVDKIVHLSQTHKVSANKIIIAILRKEFSRP